MSRGAISYVQHVADCTVSRYKIYIYRILAHPRFYSDRFCDQSFTPRCRSDLPSDSVVLQLAAANECFCSRILVRVLANYGRPMEYGRPLYFCPVIFIFLPFYLFSSPNLSCRRLDIYHASTHGVP